MPEACSDCCGAPLKVGGERSTHWWICTACSKPCNAVPVEIEHNPTGQEGFDG